MIFFDTELTGTRLTKEMIKDREEVFKDNYFKVLIACKNRDFSTTLNYSILYHLVLEMGFTLFEEDEDGNLKLLRIYTVVGKSTWEPLKVSDFYPASLKFLVDRQDKLNDFEYSRATADYIRNYNETACDVSVYMDIVRTILGIKHEIYFSSHFGFADWLHLLKIATILDPEHDQEYYEEVYKGKFIFLDTKLLADFIKYREDPLSNLKSSKIEDVLERYVPKLNCDNLHHAGFDSFAVALIIDALSKDKSIDGLSLFVGFFSRPDNTTLIQNIYRDDK